MNAKTEAPAGDVNVTERIKSAGGGPYRPPWALFFCAGLGLTLGALWLEATLLRAVPGWPRPGWVNAVRMAIMVSPWALAFFLVVRRVFTGRRYPWLAYSAGAALPWALLLSFVIGPSWAGYMGRIEFDSDAWKAAASQPGRPPTEERLEMVDDLIASGVLGDRRREEVRAMLGPDDSEDGTGYGAGYFSGWDEVYWLGPERGFMSIDSEWLVIKYGNDGRVREYRLVRD